MKKRVYLLVFIFLVFLCLDTFLILRYLKLKQKLIKISPETQRIEIIAPESEIAGWQLENGNSTDIFTPKNNQGFFVVDTSNKSPVLIPVKAEKIKFVLTKQKQAYDLVGVMGEPGAAMGSKLDHNTIILYLWINDKLLKEKNPENLNRNFIADIVAKSLFLTCEGGEKSFDDQPEEKLKDYYDFAQNFVLKKE